MDKPEKCVQARLITKKVDGPYMSYVFEDLITHDFIMCSRPPNWMGEPPQVLQEGFLKYKFVVAGTDNYFDQSTGTFKVYQYTNTYFLEFIPITHVLKDGYVTDLNTLQFV